MNENEMQPDQKRSEQHGVWPHQTKSSIYLETLQCSQPSQEDDDFTAHASFFMPCIIYNTSWYEQEQQDTNQMFPAASRCKNLL